MVILINASFLLKVSNVFEEITSDRWWSFRFPSNIQGSPDHVKCDHDCALA